MKKDTSILPSYSENPSVGFPVVETFNGNKEYRKNCKYVGGKYYIKNVDIFYIESEEKWYRITNPKIEKDYETNQWILKGTRRMNFGVVGFENNTPVFGSFSDNLHNNCIVNTSKGKTVALNPEMLIAAGYFEDINACCFYKRSDVDSSSYSSMIKIRGERSYTNKGYNIEDNAKEFEEKKKLYASYPLKIEKDARTYAKYLGDTSIGCEFETSCGTVNEWLQNRHGLVACRDGSIGSAEWVTVPMTGAKAIQNLITIGRELTKRCSINLDCSYHIHMGNLPKERVYLVALYMLVYGIQDDMLKMFPYYKTDHRGIKRKNYCQRLKKMSIYSLKDNTKEGYTQFVNSVYEKIFEYLSDGHAPDMAVNRRQQRHPIDQKWNRPSRYSIYNYQNMLFSPRETCESRLHSATLNPQRIVHWLFINNCVIKFAEHNMKRIISGERITFMDVLNFYKDHWKGDKDAEFLSEYLQAYYQERVEKFAKDIEKGDKISDWELKGDPKYSFSYKGISLFK